jgi:hypothetical protein
VKHLVYCSYCGEEHTVSEGEKECAPGAWDDVSMVPVEGTYEATFGVELMPGGSNGSLLPDYKRRMSTRRGRLLLWLLRKLT